MLMLYARKWERGLFQLFSKIMISKLLVPAIAVVNWQNKVENAHHKCVGCTLHSAAPKMSIFPIYAHTNKHWNSLQAEISEGRIFSVLAQNHFKFLLCEFLNQPIQLVKRTEVGF